MQSNTCGTVNMSQPFHGLLKCNGLFSQRDQQNLKRFSLLLFDNSDLSSVITGSAQPQITRSSIEKIFYTSPSHRSSTSCWWVRGYQRLLMDADRLLELQTNHRHWLILGNKEHGRCLRCERRNSRQSQIWKRDITNNYKNVINGEIDFTNVNLISKDDLDKIKRQKLIGWYFWCRWLEQSVDQQLLILRKNLQSKMSHSLNLITKQFGGYIKPYWLRIFCKYLEQNEKVNKNSSHLVHWGRSCQFQI